METSEKTPEQRVADVRLACDALHGARATMLERKNVAGAKVYCDAQANLRAALSQLPPLRLVTQ